jgi:hypothetical protein
VRRLLPRVDAAVISRFIPTVFGQTLRRALGTRPWRLCGATGIGRVEQLAVELARELEERARRGDRR